MNTKTSRTIVTSCSVVGILLTASCREDDDAASGSDDAEEEELTCEGYEAPDVVSAAAKVKYLLVGTALSAAERDAVLDDAGALEDFTREWVSSEAARPKIEEFFMRVLQQNGGSIGDELLAKSPYDYGKLPGGGNNHAGTFVNRTFAESSARTAYNMFASGTPYTEYFTTTTFEMTTGGLVMLAYMSERNLSDQKESRWRTLDQQITSIAYTTEEIPLSESFDPDSPNWMRLTVQVLPTCVGDTFIPDHPSTHHGEEDSYPDKVFTWFMGGAKRWYLPTQGYPQCEDNCDNGCDGNNIWPGRLGQPDSVLDFEDFEDWRSVTIRAPGPGEAATQFYELDKLRTATEILVETPRVGFLTWPGFLARWADNEDNRSRVRANQALSIVLGRIADGEESTFPSQLGAMDSDHAAAECYACHATLDPLTEFYRASYTIFGGTREDPDLLAGPAAFAIDDVTAEGTDISDLMQIFADHPRFATRAAQHLCWYANGAACPEDSEEFQRVTQDFVDGGYDYRELLIDLFTSPLVTGMECIEGGRAHIPWAAEQVQYCSALNARLAPGEGDAVPLDRCRNGRAQVIPQLAYIRNAVDPLVSSELNLLTFGAIENLCLQVGEELDSNGAASDLKIGGAEPSVLLPLLAERVLGFVEGDPRREQALEILQAHFDDALATGVTQNEALVSVFMLACEAPGVTGIGF